MVLNIELPSLDEQRLRQRAAEAGMTPEEYVRDLLHRYMERLSIEAILAPARRMFAKTKLTEDDAVELFESEKHALRRERREPEA